MESVLAVAAGSPQNQQIILPTEDEKKRLEALATVRTLHERTKPLMVAPSSHDSYVFLGEQLKLVRVAKNNLLGLWRPFVAELLKSKNDAYAQMMEGAKLMEDLESAGDKLILDYDRITREAAQRQQAQIQNIVNEQAQQEAQTTSDDQRLSAASEAWDSGNHALAEEILNAETPAPVVMPPTVVLQAPTPKIDGFSKRVTWKGRLKGADEDNPVPPEAFEALIRAVAEDLFVWRIVTTDKAGKPCEPFVGVTMRGIDQRRGLISLLKLNDSSLNAMAKAMKAQFNVAGCESYEDVGLSKRV
jgi:hypothetical protein